MAITHHVTPHDPAAHRFEVTLTVPEPDPGGQVLRMATWIPGSYTLRHFARHVIAPVATCKGRPVALHRVDGHTWRAAPCEGPLTLTYQVYAWELTVRTAHLDGTHAFFNGTSLLMEPVGQGDRPQRLTLGPGPDPACAGWQVATSMPRVSGEPWGYGTFEAADWDELIDHPFELGTFEVRSFTAGGIPHHLAVTGPHDGDLDRLVADLVPICETHLGLFGDPAPIPSYLFLLTVTDTARGGLEHRASTALIARRRDLPFAGMSEPTEGYLDLLGLFSHEYFHTWNVKRIKPRAFVPYDLSGPTPTTLLWAFEGITSYYDDLGVLRAGRMTEAAWRKKLGQTLTRVRRAPGLKVQSLADSSFGAWTGLYMPDENTANVQISYYSKGSLVALALDLHLRRETEERISLDDVMRALWARYGDGRGVPEDGVEALIGEVSGLDLSGWFDRHIRGVGPSPLEEVLPWVGLTPRARPAHGPDDKGGTAGKGPTPTGASLGAAWASDPLGVKLTSVVPGGAAHRAGLSAHDRLLAADGLRLTPSALTRLLDRAEPGRAVQVHAFRRDVLSEHTLTLDPHPHDTWWIEEIVTEGPEAERRRRWLGGAPRG